LRRHAVHVLMLITWISLLFDGAWAGHTHVRRDVSPPPWAPAFHANFCSDDNEQCLSTMCCKSDSHGCFKLAKAIYAECLPLQMARQRCTGPGTSIKLFDDSWLCPGWSSLPEAELRTTERAVSFDLSDPLALCSHYATNCATPGGHRELPARCKPGVYGACTYALAMSTCALRRTHRTSHAPHVHSPYFHSPHYLHHALPPPAAPPHQHPRNHERTLDSQEHTSHPVAQPAPYPVAHTQPRAPPPLLPSHRRARSRARPATVAAVPPPLLLTHRVDRRVRAGVTGGVSPLIPLVLLAATLARMLAGRPIAARSARSVAST
jgi:hypothetical protein